MNSSGRVGCLTRVNRLVVHGAPSSVFTLHHWSESATPSPTKSENRKRADIPNVRPCQNRLHSRYETIMRHNHARELLLKVQESALNFLVRWCLLDSSYREHQESLKLRERRGRTVTGSMKPFGKRGRHAQVARFSKLVGKHQNRLVKPTNSRLLIEEVQRLRKRNLATFARYFFWRLCTLVNVIELLLIAILAGLCAYQCYELLEDYYNYPTHVFVTNRINKDFRTDLPGITLCDYNRISKQRLKEEFPQYNETHFLAMSHGIFHSIDNFSLSVDESDKLNSIVESWYSNQAIGPLPNSSSFSPGLRNGSRQSESLDKVWRPLNSSEINWIKVARVLADWGPAGHYKLVPKESFIDSLTCAAMNGDKVPCDNLRTIASLQEGAFCRTFFHDSVLWDADEPAVAELERYLQGRHMGIRLGNTEESDMDASYLEFDDEVERREQDAEELEEQRNEERIRFEMENMEIIRLRLRFRGEDYANRRDLVGGRVAVHSGSIIGEITHQSYLVEPGYWYTYYIERSDYYRLPPPYNTHCFDYDANRNVWSKRREQLRRNSAHNYELITRQSLTTDHLIAEYGDLLRSRTTGKRECIKTCLSELSTRKCGCWNQNVPYIMMRAFEVHMKKMDSNRMVPWCSLQRLDEIQRRLNMTASAGDDLFYQVCSRSYTPICLSACPDECFYSSLEVLQQSRSWPSHEARRYSDDRRIWRRLREEAECCATISIVYTSPASTSLVTEPKYTRQDMVTIISGNIEAWLGISAVHAYLFFEQLFEALFGQPRS